MPKHPNKTAYDNQMNIFKVNPTTPKSRQKPPRLPPASGNFPASSASNQPAPYGSYLPSTAAPQPPAPAIRTRSSSRHQQPSSSAAQHQAISQPYNFANAPASFAQPSTSTSAPPQAQLACWIMDIFAYPYNGEPSTRRMMPIERGKMPQTTCICGCAATIRILHMPSIVDWQPPFGVLWNFIQQTTGANNWVEGQARENTISAAHCPYCNSYIALYGPPDFHAMV